MLLNIEPTEEEIADAISWARNYCSRELAYQIALPGLSESQMNSIEGVWATTLDSTAGIVQKLKNWRIFTGSEEIRAAAFGWIRHNK